MIECDNHMHSNMFKNSKIYIVGHNGLLGSALLKQLESEGYSNIIKKTHEELDLTNQKAVNDFFQKERPEYVFLAAGLTGGIVANNTYPATFLHTNIAIQDNVFQSSQKYKVKHLVFYGSSCTYPKNCSQPIKEEYLHTGKLEETSEAYAIAKIAGITACKAYNNQFKTNRFIALIPSSMYGPNDNFDLENSHVISALIRKMHLGKCLHNHDFGAIRKDLRKRSNLIQDVMLLNDKEIITVLSKHGIKIDSTGRSSPSTIVEIWGSGNPRREFISSGDVANASIFVMRNAERLQNMHYNVGTGIDYSIKELAEIIARIVGFNGKVTYDVTKPDGVQRKLLDSSKLRSLRWKHKISFEEGIKKTYEWYIG